MAIPPLPREDLDHILASTDDLWPEVAGKTIFITGATGFFGSWLVESILHANDQRHLGIRVIALTRDPDRFCSGRPHLGGRVDLDFIKGDVKTFKFPDTDCHLIIHAAADVTASSHTQPSVARVANMVAGTHKVLDLAACRNTASILYVSSGAVYGPQPPLLIRMPEAFQGSPDPLAPGSDYGLAKRACESLCTSTAEQIGLEAKIARCFAFVGPLLPLDGRFAIGNFLSDALARRPIIIKGDGRPFRSYMYPIDLAIWLWTILIAGQPSRAYNVGSPEEISILETARLVAKTVGINEAPTVMTPASETLPPRYVPDISRAEKELGLKVHIPLDEALRRTSCWYQPSCQ